MPMGWGKNIAVQSDFFYLESLVELARIDGILCAIFLINDKICQVLLIMTMKMMIKNILYHEHKLHKHTKKNKVIRTDLCVLY